MWGFTGEELEATMESEIQKALFDTLFAIAFLQAQLNCQNLHREHE